jgi:prevent-host-death family protein
MRAVNIAQLKNNLSSYLKRVREGEEFVVADRNLPIARLMPWVEQEGSDDLTALARQGKLKLGSGEIEETFWARPAPRVDARRLKEAIQAERADD